MLIAAIEEKRELVQQLWFFGHETEAMSEYIELKRLRARLKELTNADTGLNNPGADGDQATE